MALICGLLYLRLGYNQSNIQDRAGAVFFVLTFMGFNGITGVLGACTFLRSGRLFLLCVYSGRMPLLLYHRCRRRCGGGYWRFARIFLVAILIRWYPGVCICVVPAEKLILIRERAAGSYRVSAYVLGKMLAELPLDLFFPILFAAIAYYMINLNVRRYCTDCLFVSSWGSAADM